MAQSVRFLPVGLFGGVMGIEGLGLACRDSPLPHLGVFGELFVWLGLAALAVLLAAYAAKLARHPAAVADDLTQPLQMGFFATLPLAMVLCGGGLFPYLEAPAQALWWGGAGLLLAAQVWALYRWISGGIDLDHVNGGWMIIMIGGIVVPGTGVPLENIEMSRFLFGASAVAAPFVMGLVFHRTVVGSTMPEALRPTWFIFLVPPSLIYANGLLLSPGPPGLLLDGAFYAALLLAPALLLAARGFLRWPFAPTWWAFTFPLDALSVAAGRHAKLEPTAFWEAVAAAALVLALFFVAVALWMTLKAVKEGRVAPIRV